MCQGAGIRQDHLEAVRGGGCKVTALLGFLLTLSNKGKKVDRHPNTETDRQTDIVSMRMRAGAFKNGLIMYLLPFQSAIISDSLRMHDD